ncbi:3-keto-disaccharide hydrolase [Fimbriiglobus ruber]|uniref:3-keto-alpha-glucoside-1,2-lyase/3-keto-2-hydroxy-glucal hydratase domain-containing protein n=1 Tax=Fimbriiglobus ruber TaxID=1908690 RepID=A0A225D0K3_9BACT|nr:DUF1080 domain-containing protein [Fimbriiglobus ruber]OWK35121.1 hypothetical protein FRUB_09963 [Fimbriiglobus ruber]
MRYFLSRAFSLAAVAVVSLTLSARAADPAPVSGVDAVVKKLPATEKPIHLFDGKDLDGWDGAKEYWSVQDGAIRGANTSPVPSSTYLFTKDSYRNFRLLLEVKQTRSPKHSPMHSAVAVLGERFTDKGDNAHGFKGPLVMFCNDWGVWDAHRRNRVAPGGAGGKLEKVGEWNLIEVLAVGNHIRCAANGGLVFDFTDKPEMLKESPIGLQLHANGQPQEFLFRGLVLTKDPEDKLVTAKDEAKP